MIKHIADRYYQNLLEAAFRHKGSKQLAYHYCNEGYCCLCDAFKDAVDRKSWRTAWRIWFDTSNAYRANTEAGTQLQNSLRVALEEKLELSE